MTATCWGRWAWAEVDLGAIAHNTRLLKQRAGTARLCAVVKADGYGHGAVPVARTSLANGADWLAVAFLDEATELRRAGIEAPILVLVEPHPAQFDELVALGDVRPNLYTVEGVEAADDAALASGERLAVHVEINTGMNRVGVMPNDLHRMTRLLLDRPFLDVEGVWTHLPVADEPDNPFTADQLGFFDECVAEVVGLGLRPRLIHAANSAGTIDHPEGHIDMVRCGIALYGLAPAPALAGRLDLRPAMSLKARVGFVKTVYAGMGVSYGHRYRPESDAVVATVPLGYADGVRRRLGHVGGEVLIGGVRRPIAGTVTMDQLMVVVDDTVSPGDEVVVFGRQGDGYLGADEVAERLETIAYEVVCDVGPRVPRVYVGGETADG